MDEIVDPKTLVPETDETGDIDISLLRHNLSLTPAQRMREHASALALVRALEKARAKRQRESSAAPQTPE